MSHEGREQDDHDRGIRNEERLCNNDEKWIAHGVVHKLEAEALALQAKEYERRLDDLNHENARIAGRDILYATRESVEALTGTVGITLPREVFDTFLRETYKAEAERRDARIAELERTTLQSSGNTAAIERGDTRLKSLEDWKARAAGFGVLVAIFSGVAGAAIAKALG